jgi:hypothetical protein
MVEKFLISRLCLSSNVAENLTHNPENESSNPSTGTCRKKIGKGGVKKKFSLADAYVKTLVSNVGSMGTL